MQVIHKIKIGFYGKAGEDVYKVVKYKNYKRFSYSDAVKAVKEKNKDKVIWYLDILEFIEMV
jgi:hypothetical protein